jgi:signal transduction histidine kinase/ligand-binding sensor domain-containing protein
MKKIQTRRILNIFGCRVAFGVAAWMAGAFLLSCSLEETIPNHRPTATQKIVEPAGAQVDVPALPIRTNPMFEIINVEHGLSQSTVFSVVQDNAGYLWFGTEDGLNRYDGYNFKVYRFDSENPLSISHHWINKLLVDHTGALWICTDGGGLNRYDSATDGFVRYVNDPEDETSLINNEVTAILEDRNGDLWLGTRGGLSKFDREMNNFRNFRNQGISEGSISKNEILALYEDTNGMLWIGTDGAGLCRFDRAAEIFVNYSIDTAGDKDRRGAVRAIFEDSRERLWIGTQGGLMTFDTTIEQFGLLAEVSEPFGNLNTAVVYSIYEDRDGIVWVGTWGDGIFAIKPGLGVLQNYRQRSGGPRSLSSNMLISSYQDREGTLWIGTAAAGVCKLTIDNRAFAYFKHDPDNPNSLSNNWVRSIFEDDDGILWISTGDGGLNRYDQVTETWTNYRNDPDNPHSVGANFLSQVSQDRMGNLWIATENGVDRFNKSDETFTHFRDDPSSTTDRVDTNRIRHVYEDRSGRLWVGTAGFGIAELDPKTGIFSGYRHDPENSNSLIHDKVWQINEDSLGYLWISTSGGLSRFDPETETFTSYQADPTNPEGLTAHYVISTMEDPSGTIWVASAGGGLQKFVRESDTFLRWTEADGLPNDVVYSVAVDEQGNLWISTNNGLSRFNPESETFTNFQIIDGQPIVEFNGNAMGRSKTGELFFGGINGFISFHPSSVQKNQYIPPIVITTIHYGDGPALSRKIPQEITIKWPNDSFEFEFSALSFSNPEYNQYAYILEGLDSHWIEAKNLRAGRYDRLPGGTYTLRVIGSNDDELWNDTGTALHITVIPPFWETWLFRGLIIAVILGVVAGLYLLRVNNIKARNRKLESEVQERTAALKQEAAQRLATEGMLHRARMESAVAEERGRLARDLHDSVTQSLYSLTLFTEATREMAESGRLDQVKHGLGRSADTALQALKEMRLLVYELRPLALTDAGLVEAIRHRLDAVENRAGVKTKILVNNAEGMQLPQDVEEAAFRISQEALNNALKHAHAAEITVHISISAERGDFELEVADDGIGFNPDDDTSQGGLGLDGIRERAAGIGARISIDSTPDKGTVVKLIVEKT